MRRAKSSAIISITNNTHRHSEKHLKLFSKQNGSVTHCVFSEELSYYVPFISQGECQRKEFREPHKRRQQSHTRCPPAAAHCCNPAQGCLKYLHNEVPEHQHPGSYTVFPISFISESKTILKSRHQGTITTRSTLFVLLLTNQYRELLP